MASPHVEGATRSDCSDLFTLRDLRQKLRQQRAIPLAARCELDRAYIPGLRVHRGVNLQPLPATRCALLACQPFAVAPEPHPRAVDMQLQRLARTAIGDLHVDPRLASTQRRTVRNRPIEPSHSDQALDQPDHLSKRKAEQHFQSEADLDRCIREGFGPPPLAGLSSTPDRVGIKPDRERALAWRRFNSPDSKSESSLIDMCNMYNRPMRKRACEAIWARHRVLTCIRPQLRPSSCRGPAWCSKIGSRSKPRARRHSVAPWFFRSRLTTIAPSCSLPCHAPTSPRLTDSLRRRSRSLVDATPGHQSPDYPRHFVRQRHAHQYWWLARQHSTQPSPRLC